MNAPPRSPAAVRAVARLAAAIAALCLGADATAQEAAAQEKELRDPAPPTVLPVDTAAVVPLQEREGTRVHGAPRPLAEGAVTEDRRSFLGPRHDGTSAETPLLQTWGPDGPPRVWEMDMGSGYCAPAVQHPYLVIGHRIADEEVFECLHPEDGRRYWRFSYPTAYVDQFGYSDGPRCPPLIDGDWVYTYGAEGKLHCLHLRTGALRWKRDLPAEFAVDPGFFGVGATPLIHDSLLIVNLGVPGGPCVVAFDKQSGALRWGAGRSWGASYASPVPGRVHERDRVFVFAGGESRPPTGGLLCIDPANGAVDFEFPWRARSYASVNSSCPVIVGDQVLISASYGKGSALLELDEALEPTQRWTTEEFGLHFHTAAMKDGHAYGFEGRNEPDTSFACLDLASGEVVWREWPSWDQTFRRGASEFVRPAGYYRAQLLAADGAHLCLGELGHLAWLELSPSGYRERCRAALFLARETWSLMVLSRGLLYIRQNTRDLELRAGPRLLCYDLRGAPRTPRTP